MTWKEVLVDFNDFVIGVCWVIIKAPLIILVAPIVLYYHFKATRP